MAAPQRDVLTDIVPLNVKRFSTAIKSEFDRRKPKMHLDNLVVHPIIMIMILFRDNKQTFSYNVWHHDFCKA